MLSGVKDADQEILKHINDRELIKVCSINRRAWNSICDDNFLKRRLLKYPGIEKYKKPEESYKQFFLRFIYYTSKLREKFQYEYTAGNFKRQYYVLDKYKDNKLLIGAAKYKELDLLNVALERGIDVHIDNEAALKAAVENQDHEITSFLLEKGANILAIDQILINIYNKGNLDFVKYLLEHGANIHVHNEYLLIQSFKDGNLDFVKYLLENGADIHSHNDYLLIQSFEKKDLDFVKYLLENGANIHAYNEYLLIQSFKDGNLGFVKYLLENGANIHAHNDYLLKNAYKI
jgi:ribosomal protein S12